MSRDFTPREMHLVDRELLKAGKDLKKLTWEDPETGETVPLHRIDPRFPNLSFLFAGEIPDSRISELAEDALARIIHAEDTGEMFVPKSEVETMVFRWFNGDLANRFYYREENNSVLSGFLWREETDAANVALNFPDWETLPRGEWSSYTIGDVKEKRYTGLYREQDGTYTLQRFIGDEVAFCETVTPGKPERKKEE